MDDEISQNDNAKHVLTKVPKVTDSEFRLVCNDVAESLSKNWRFRGTIFGLMLLATIALAILIAGFYGWTAHDQVKKAKADLDKFIHTQFQREDIKKTIQEIADNKATKLIHELIQPSIVNTKKSIADFNQYLDDQKKAIDEKMSILRQEVSKLQQRNNITILADKAIANGDSNAFHELKKMSENLPNDGGAMAELIRVYAAYSPNAPLRWENSHLIANDKNPNKFNEENLKISDLLDILNNNKMVAARTVAARILAKKSRFGSFSTAVAIIYIIKKEDNLIVMQYLNEAFKHVTGYAYGQPDGSDILDWWEKNKANFVKINTDEK